MKIIYKYKWRDIIISFVFLIICISTKSTIHIGSTIYKIMLGICFVEIGILIEQYLIIEKLGRIKYILLIIAAMLAQVNGSVEMIEGRIGNPVVYFLCATMTSVSVLALFKNAESNNSKLLLVLEKYGKNTIVLLVTNNLLIEMIRLIDYKITGNILIRLGIFGSILFTVGLLIIEWWFIKVANGPLGFLFGRMRKEER